MKYWQSAKSDYLSVFSLWDSAHSVGMQLVGHFIFSLIRASLIDHVACCSVLWVFISSGDPFSSAAEHVIQETKVLRTKIVSFSSQRIPFTGNRVFRVTCNHSFAKSQLELAALRRICLNVMSVLYGPFRVPSFADGIPVLANSSGVCWWHREDQERISPGSGGTGVGCGLLLSWSYPHVWPFHDVLCSVWLLSNSNRLGRLYSESGAKRKRELLAIAAVFWRDISWPQILRLAQISHFNNPPTMSYLSGFVSNCMMKQSMILYLKITSGLIKRQSLTWAETVKPTRNSDTS